MLRYSICMSNATNLTEKQKQWLARNGWALDGAYFKQHGHMINQRNTQTGRVEAVPAYLVVYSERRDGVFILELIAENDQNQSPRLARGSLKSCFAVAESHYGASRRSRLQSV